MANCYGILIPSKDLERILGIMAKKSSLKVLVYAEILRRKNDLKVIQWTHSANGGGRDETV